MNIHTIQVRRASFALHDKIKRLRKQYARMTIAVANFNKVHDMEMSGYWMAQRNKLHRELLSYENLEREL